MFKALVIENDEQGYRSLLKDLPESQLPDHDVTLDVSYSSLNYKDALAICNKGPIVRHFPMVPGIDFVGRVTASRHPDWKEDDVALLTGWGVGEKQWGGLAQKASVSGDWLVRPPATLSPLQTMAIGTAGLTAMLCVMALEKQGITPDQGPVLVTGASGGVGSYSVSLLARLGYQVIASSGRTSDHAYLIDTLGAASVIDREELSQPGKPLAKERWAAAIDSVGSHTLANVLAATQRDGAVAACGMAQGLDLPASVAPFILRGVTLAGVDSVMCPKPLRQQAWQRLGELMDSERLSKLSRVIPLSEAREGAQALLDGKVQGRLIVDCR
ncbi:MDR family oxidoreductase [Pantoea agglomerans]|uniref:acrylyl-CoA reductase (NADPH) n=1 Tax=Enterobacter agglomerans TaxID=549 RepID=UPI0004500260|nr:MDR family oxidoreductase [Pantoea agglomerans]EZI31480.1 Zinc-containing alcohol dehydrogenase superfamily protein [Pantoea agglomerans]EZI36207.1 Zinc-containing alcohol dehydrogenase superfamily protein [Pantoea agglomerans]MBD8159587.1 oxidoreductase [Pantoea agglomerans]MBD8231847.1 oxidoreductase [Pantoea agglomerans]MCL9651077.1 oxidoreductase [Pantoea agglomerans]